MTSVEKRRSRRKSRRHRKQSDGGFSDASSGGSFLDETDREVSNLTDRAFRSLCIGDEAVYNDSDICSSSPCTQRDRQLAFSQNGQDGDREGREREELKTSAHESFSFRVQQYGQDWMHGGIYGAEIHRDPQWEVYGERTQGRVSATFQHSVLEMSQQEKSVKEEQLAFFNNGATESSSQQRRSRSRVSSLIKAFNSEGIKDEAGMDGKLREWNDETSWDKSALMSMQRELSEFSTSYRQNISSGYFPSAGPFPSQDTNFYSSEVAAVAQMDAASSFMRSSHSKHSMLQVNCNSNFFMHSEFSPFRVWRDHNRFPFQRGGVSGFMHCSEFPKWCETPMYKELSMEAQPRCLSVFEERGSRHRGNAVVPVVPPNPKRSTSTSTVLQKASAIEKRSESEVVGHYPHRMRTQSLGANRLQSQRPSTASPTIEMSRRVRDTINSVKALQQKIKLMTEQNIATEMTASKQEVICSNENVIPFETTVPKAVSGNTTSFNISQLLTPKVHVHQEAETPEGHQYAVSSQPVEHPPVRAESRGGTPDVRMSSYKSRAPSLLFNLKDNRKRVKSTYSPTNFKGLETLEKYKQTPIQEPRDAVIDVPEFIDRDIQISRLEESSCTDVNQYYNPGLSLAGIHSQTAVATIGHHSGEHQTAQRQGEMVHHSGVTGFIPENYSSNQLTNGQNPYEDLSSFTPYKQGLGENVNVGGEVYRHKPSYRAAEMPKLNADMNHSREYLINKENTQNLLNEAAGRESVEVDRYQQIKENKQDYSNVSSQDTRRQTKPQVTEKLSLNASIPQWKQEMSALTEKDRHAVALKEDLSSARDKFRRENQQNTNRESKQTSQEAQPCNDVQNPAYYGHQLPGAFRDKYIIQKYNRENEENEMKEKYLMQNHHRHADREYRNVHAAEDRTGLEEEKGQTKQYAPTLKEHEVQSLQRNKPQHNTQKNLFSVPDKASAPTRTSQVKDRQCSEVKAVQNIEAIQAQHTQVELAKAQHRPQVEQPRGEATELILAGRTCPEKIKAELPEQDGLKLAKAEFKMSNKTKTELNEAEQQRKEQRTEKETLQSGGKESKQAREEQTKTDVTRDHDIKEESNAAEVKAEEADAGRLKDKHVRDEPAKTKQQVQAQPSEKERSKPKRDVKDEQTEANKRKAEQAKLQQRTEQHVDRGQEDTVGAINFTAEPNVEDVGEKKADKDSIHVDQVNSEQPGRDVSKAKEAEGRKTGEAELAQTKLAKTDYIRSAKPTAKLAMSQQKSQTSRVEQVKTELAKAKAELAKITEKMREDKKEKVKNIVIKKEKDVPSGMNIKEPAEATQTEDVVVNKYSRDQAARGADDYESLRGKYGFINPVSTPRNKTSAAGHAATNDDLATPSLDEGVKMNNKKSKDEHPTIKFGKIENKEQVGRFKSNEVAESHYVYSESSKDFTLSGADYSPASADKRINGETVIDKTKHENCDPQKHPDVSNQKDSDVSKPPEIKPKSSEHGVASGKDPHLTPFRAPSHKERALTKQEILTSKIKAHAEKEISAIKEGFAIRDGFSSKNSTKQLSSGQNIHVRQRPLPQELSKKQESRMPSNTTPKHQLGPSGIEPMKAVTPSSSAATNQTQDHTQKQVTEEPLKSHGAAPEPPTAANQPGSHPMSTDGDLIERQKKKDQPVIKPPTQNKEQEPQNIEGKQAEDSENLKKDLMNKPALNTDRPNKVKSEPSQDTSHHEVIHADSSPSIKLAVGQIETSEANDSLQIMGIMVTVKERMNNTQEDICIQEKTLAKAKEKEHSNPEAGQCNTSSGLEVNKGNESMTDVSTGKISGVGQETSPIAKVDETTVGMNSESENVQGTSTRENNVTECVTDKRVAPQQRSSYMNVRPQRETQLQEPPAVKDPPPTATDPSINKVPEETQPLLYKQDIVEGEIKDKMPEDNCPMRLSGDQEGITTEEDNSQSRPVNETLTANVVSTGIDRQQDTNRGAVETQPLVKEDTENAVNQPRSGNMDHSSAALLEEKRHDSTPSISIGKASPQKHLPEYESRRVSVEHQYEDTHIGNNNQLDNNVHIGSIAISVVPAVADKDSLNLPGKHQIKAVCPDVVVAEEHHNSTMNKDPTPTSHEKQMEDKLRVQYVLSSVRDLAKSLKTSNQNQSTSAARESTQAESGESERVPRNGTTVKIQPMEGDYFQVQGVTAVSEGREFPELLQQKAATSIESHKEGKQVLAVDQSKKKIEESCSAITQDDNIKRHTKDAGDKSNLKQSECPADTQSSNCEKVEAGQALHLRKHHRERRSSSSARERHSRHSQPAREKAVKEEPEVKPKPRERGSTIPDISALADYARLKVIVSEDQENAIQEFPPNKKEGFFPLIQSRHSRRPVFTADLQELPVKEKSLPSKTEESPNVSKKPKPVVFPIKEKDHQRTGMFKLGEKERREKNLLDVNDNEGVLDNVARLSEPLTERQKASQAHFKNQGSSEEVPGTQRVNQEEQSIYQPNDHALQATASSSSINKSRNTSESQQLLDSSDLDEKPEEPELNLDNDSHAQPLLGPKYNMKESQTNLRKGETFKDKDTAAKTGEERSETNRPDRFPCEETKEKSDTRAKQLEEEQASRRREEYMRTQHMLEDSRASITEESRRVAQREEERRAKEREAVAMEVKERRARQKEAEDERKAKQVDDNRAAVKEDRRANQREEIKIKDIEEQRKTKTEEESREKLRDEQRIKDRRLKQREEERVAQEEQRRRDALIEEQIRAKHIEEERRRVQLAEEKRIHLIEEQKKQQQQIEEQRREMQKKEEWMRTQKEEEERRVAEKEKAIAKRREWQANEERNRILEERRARREEEIRAKRREDMLEAQREEEIRAKRRGDMLEAQREEERASQVEEQKREAQMIDALQYYAINSTGSKRKPRERQPCSPLPFQQRNHPSESTEDNQRRLHRPHAPASPALSLPRSNTSSPALGAKPSMFRVKDNTIRGSSFTRSVKPQFHKNFGEEFRVGSPMEQRSRRGEDDLETKRDNAGTPVQPDTAPGSKRLAAIKECQTFKQTSSSQDYSAPLSHHRPYSRRSIAPDEDDSRSIISNMSEDVESFATSAADLADVRGLYDYERPESACSFSSDVSRSMGKPPAVPPKSERALRRAQRLTTRRIKKELSKSAGDSPAEKSIQGVSSIPSSSSEVCSSNRHTMASPHFAPPVSLIHAPASGSSFSSSHTDHQLSHRHLHASPHAIAPVSHSVAPPNVTPVSLPVASPHATAPVSLPVASPHATAPVSLPVASHHATAPVSLSVASPHATAPVSLPVASPHATAPLPVGSHQATAPVFLPVAFPHATEPVSLPVAPPHATAPVSPRIASARSTPVFLPVASPHATVPVSLPVAPHHANVPISQPAPPPQTVPHVPSSPTLLYANHPAPVTQYHVESSYPQPYPVTQRRVLQDIGSGQLFLVDAPVQVKMKTFFDPETGKYVQLNVRESGQNISRPQSQQMFPQPQLQPHLQVRQQQQILSQASPAGKPLVLYQGYHGCPQGYQPVGTSAVHHQRASSGLSAPVSLSQEQQSVRDDHIYRYQTSENGQNSEGHCYSPEKTPYMDTVNDTGKTFNAVYNTHDSYESFPECESNSQLAGSTVCENDNSGLSRCQPRDIITMSELDDFMELSDW